MECGVKFMTAVVLSCTWYCHDDVAYMMFSSFASNTTGFQLINDSQHKNILRKKDHAENGSLATKDWLIPPPKKASSAPDEFERKIPFISPSISVIVVACAWLRVSIEYIYLFLNKLNQLGDFFKKRLQDWKFHMPAHKRKDGGVWCLKLVHLSVCPALTNILKAL